MYKTAAYAKKSAKGKFELIEIERNEAGPDDVQFDVVYCGICHTDVTFSEDLPTTKYPIVPGHELAGVVTKVGGNVKDVSVGDHVGVGCIVDSCLNCDSCNEGCENYCLNEMTMTYNYETKYGRVKTEAGYSHGGYSKEMTINRKFLIKIPKEYPLEAAGPILCAGITMFAPLSHWKADKGGKKVGIIGIGGLGQMGLRLAKAMGNTVVAISRSDAKKQIAMEIGADEFIVSQDPESIKTGAKSFDVILNTVCAKHNVMDYMSLLKRDGTLVQLGVVLEPLSFSNMALFGRINLSGSMIGSIKETQDCIDLCNKYNIKPALEVVTASQLDEVYDKLRNGNDQITRYVLDIKKSFN